MPRSLILGLWLVSVPLACGDDGRSGGSVGYEDLPAAQVDALCDFFVRCGFTTSVELCLEGTADLASLPGDLDAALATGSVRYDASAADECLAALRGAACASFLDAFDEEVCDRVFVGTIADGEGCFIDEQCVSGECGQTLQCGEACCEGTCVAPLPEAAVGESCAETECAGDAYCDFETDLCTAPKVQGEACPGSFECDVGLGCIDGVCEVPPGEGEACAGFQCAIPLACDVETMTCVPLRGEGEACSPLAGICALGLSCSIESNTCERPGGAGTSCDVSVIGSSCNAETYCAYDLELMTGTCEPLVADGGACIEDDVCASGYCGVDQTCEIEPVCVQ